jgi:hypothetical protein
MNTNWVASEASFKVLGDGNGLQIFHFVGMGLNGIRDYLVHFHLRCYESLRYVVLQAKSDGQD